MIASLQLLVFSGGPVFDGLFDTGAISNNNVLIIELAQLYQDPEKSNAKNCWYGVSKLWILTEIRLNSDQQRLMSLQLIYYVIISKTGSAQRGKHKQN
jgi:hypothetical protein